jgi:hypothetical protein
MILNMRRKKWNGNSTTGRMIPVAERTRWRIRRGRISAMGEVVRVVDRVVDGDRLGGVGRGMDGCERRRKKPGERGGAGDGGEVIGYANGKEGVSL